MSNQSNSNRFDRRQSNPKFATTRWSMVNLAADTGSDRSKDSLQELCESYWFPLYSFARRKVASREKAEDLIQSFFVSLLEKNAIGKADETRGRFRAFLIGSLKNFMANEWDRENTQKRGGGKSILSLDFENGESRFSIEPTIEATAEQAFNRNWAITLLNRVLEQMETDHSQKGEGEKFLVLKPFVAGSPVGTYAEIASKLRLTESAAKMAVVRLRKEYRAALRNEIAQTVLGEDQIDDEIRDLFSAVK